MNSMNSPALLQVWLQLLGLLAIEVALVASVVAVIGRAGLSAVWRRTWCQMAVVTVLVLTFAELTGSARALAFWARQYTAVRQSAARTPQSQRGEVASQPKLSESFRAEVETRLAAHRARRQTDPRLTQNVIASLPPESRQNFARPDKPVVDPSLAALKGTESVSDSVGMLWLGVIWVAGTAVVTGRTWLAHGLLLLFRWRRRPVADRALLERVRRLSRSIGMSRPVLVVESARLNAPVAFGLIRPMIGLPMDFCIRFNVARQEAMLAHELGHLTGRDPCWYLLADLAAAVLWWHPAVWWLRHQLQTASELAADEASLLVEDGPRVLAECLVELGARLTNPTVLGQMSVSGFRSALGRRVHQLICLEGRARGIPRRGRATTLVSALGAASVAVVVVLCTAWASPQAVTKGDSMKTMQLNWKRSLATFALLAAVQSPNAATVPAGAAAPQPTSAVPAPPSTPVAPEPVVAPTPPPAPTAWEPTAPTTPMSPERQSAFYRRYGLMVPATGASGGTPAGDTTRRKQTEAKLGQIVLPEVVFDNLPLGEVVKFLSEQCRKLDPAKEGVNLLLNPTVPVRGPEAAIVDPSTGIPVVSAPTEEVDVATIAIRFNLPLRKVTVKDALNAIVLVAERPIEYKVEDYGVVLSLKNEPSGGAVRLPEPLVVRTYKVDTNTLAAGLENAFGIKRDLTQGETSSLRTAKLQSALKELFVQLGISMSPTKSIFYNDLTGIIMVRGTSQDQDLVSAAIETLGGAPAGAYTSGGGGGASASNARAVRF